MSKQARHPRLIPYLTVQSAESAIEFYRAAFGFELDAEPATGDEGKIEHAEMRFMDDAVIMFAAEGAFGETRKAPATHGGQPPMTLYLYCDDVDEHFKRAAAAGAKVLMPPQDMFWGDRMCQFADPDGYHWSFATPLRGR